MIMMAVNVQLLYLLSKYATKPAIKPLGITYRFLIKTVRNLSTTSIICSGNVDEQAEKSKPQKKVSIAMQAYLKRAQEHEEFMTEQTLQYNLGKRHLANMMGEDPEHFTQEDVDRAIEYLFPSGLFVKKSRPIMKPPEEVFPKQKAAEFDETGRPHHYLFYTGCPNYYQILHEIVVHMKALNKFEDTMLRKQLQADETQALNPTGSEWLSKELFQKQILENLTDTQYDEFITSMERLSQHPYSYRAKDFVEQFRRPLTSQRISHEVPKPEYDEDGRAFITVKECPRKTARAVVTVRVPGTGKLTINDQDINYFQVTQCREQLLFPLLFTNMLGKVDIEATVEGGGPSGQTGAIRYGISWAMRSFVDSDMLERMRVAGLLSKDYRRRERKKPGQAKARKKFTWKKR